MELFWFCYVASELVSRLNRSFSWDIYICTYVYVYYECITYLFKIDIIFT